MRSRVTSKAKKITADKTMSSCRRRKVSIRPTVNPSDLRKKKNNNKKKEEGGNGEEGEKEEKEDGDRWAKIQVRKDRREEEAERRRGDGGMG